MRDDRKPLPPTCRIGWNRCACSPLRASRIRQLAERYGETLPQITDEVAALAARVEQHLKQMGAAWK